LGEILLLRLLLLPLLRLGLWCLLEILLLRLLLLPGLI